MSKRRRRRNKTPNGGGGGGGVELFPKQAKAESGRRAKKGHTSTSQMLTFSMRSHRGFPDRSNPLNPKPTAKFNASPAGTTKQTLSHQGNCNAYSWAETGWGGEERWGCRWGRAKTKITQNNKGTTGNTGARLS